MTSRTCPWCGGANLHIANVVGSTMTIYWEDRDCGYREKTGYQEEGYPIKGFVKPKPPLPPHKQPEYLRNGIVVPEVQQGQLTFDEGAKS